MPSFWIEALGFVAGIIGVFIAAPQLVRVVRLKSDAGVSLWTWLIITFSNAAWIGYGFRFDSPSQIGTNFLAGLLSGALTFVLLRSRVHDVWAVLIILAVWTLAFGSIMLEPVGLVSFEIMLGLTSRVPQVATSFKSWRLGRITAVSNTSNVVAIVASGLWIIYAVITDLWTIAYFSGAVIVLTVLVMLFEAGARRRARYLVNEQS